MLFFLWLCVSINNFEFIKSSYDSLKDIPSAERCLDLCKDMHVLAKLASTTTENYMKMKNHIHMLTKSGLSCEHNPPSQALQVGSTSNLSVNGTMVENNKVHSPFVKRIRGKPPSIQLVSAVEKEVVKKS